MDLSELLGQQGEKHEPPPRLPSDMTMIQHLALINEIARGYGTCSHAPGDLITPRVGSQVPHTGEPMVVLEVEKEASEGRALMVRVAFICGGYLLAGWIEHWRLTPWSPPRGNAASN